MWEWNRCGIERFKKSVCEVSPIYDDLDSNGILYMTFFFFGLLDVRLQIADWAVGLF